MSDSHYTEFHRIGLRFDVMGEPNGRMANEANAPAFDRQLDLDLSVVGRVCALSLLATFVSLLCALVFARYEPLAGAVVGLGATAIALRWGESRFGAYMARRFQLAAWHVSKRNGN